MQQPQSNPLDDFDPNAAPEPFATFVPRRGYRGGRAGFKTHTRRQDALAALRSHGTGILYRSERGKWVEVCRFDDPRFLRPICDSCNQTTLEDEDRWDYKTRQRVKTGRRVNRISQVFERLGSRGKLVEPLRVLKLCSSCKRGLGY